MDQNRLTEVETRYSYLEHIVDELSHVVHEQQRTIDRLSLRVKRLESLATESTEPTPEPLPHEKPPHY